MLTGLSESLLVIGVLELPEPFLQLNDLLAAPRGSISRKVVATPYPNPSLWVENHIRGSSVPSFVLDPEFLGDEVLSDVPGPTPLPLELGVARYRVHIGLLEDPGNIELVGRLLLGISLELVSGELPLLARSL